MPAVLFDFNGTLSNDEPILCAIFQDLFAEAGKPISEEDYFGELFGLSDPELVERWLGRSDEELVARKIDRYRDLVADGRTVDDDAREAIRFAAEQGPVAIVSGSSRAEIEPVLDAAGIRDTVETIVAMEDVARGKPAPDGYLRALEMLGVASGVAIEDSPPGIAAAKAAGLRCAAVVRSFARERLGGADLYATAVDRDLIRQLVSSG